MRHARRPIVPAIIVFLCSSVTYSQQPRLDSHVNPWRSTDQHTAEATQSAARPPTKYVPGQILVRFRQSISKQRAQAANAFVGSKVVREFRFVDNLQLVQLPTGTSVKQAIKYYRARPEVLYAEPNYIRHTDQAPITPNDPRFSEMWNLHNTGQTGGTPGADIHAPEAWALGTGDPTVVVGVIDTGIDYTHPDLNANVFHNPSDCNSNGLDDDGNGYVDDCHGIDVVNHDSNPIDDAGHGTHVAGTIGATGNNGTGVVGVNWQVQIIACKFLDSGGAGDVAGAIACLDYLAKMKDSGVNIVATNNSYGGGGFSRAEWDAIDAHRRRGILFIASAGNSYRDTDLIPSYPAGYDLPNVISVSASDHNDSRADFSNFGRRSVHLAAPGKDILSTVPEVLFGDLYWSASGTSMAAPHVTGTAALLKAQSPARDWKEIKNLIMAGGDIVPGAAETMSRSRLSAYGAMTCSNRVIQLRLMPAQDDTYLWVDDWLKMTYLNINCGDPNGVLEVTVDGGPEKIIFADDGIAPDLEAGDGIYVAHRQWVASEVGNHTLTFPNNDVLVVHVISSLAPYTFTTEVPYEYRDITGNDLFLGDDDSAVVHPPFPIHFGGTDFTILNVNSNGNVTFFAPFVEWENTTLPAAAPTLVAPFWDDLYGTVKWAVIGSAPNREFVVDWHSAAMACFWSEYPTYDARFQTVFFENSSDILFNYAAVMLGREHIPDDEWWGCIGPQNAGANATVGVQSTSEFANQYSFNTPVLSANSSILWRLGSMTPTIAQLSPVDATAGASAFTLSVVGQSFLPDAVVRWNGNALATNFVNAGLLTATVPAASIAASGTAQITVFNPGPNGSGDSAAVLFPIHDSNPIPTLTSVAPDAISIMRETVPLVVTGTGFCTGSVARWNGVSRTTTVLSSNQLRMTPLMSDYISTGPAQLTVFNPTPGGGLSNALPVTIVNPAPRLDSTFPVHLGAGNSGFTLQLSGDGFSPASVVRWNGSDRPTTLVHLTHQMLTAEIPASDVASIGTAQITVFNPTPGGGTSEPSSFSIVAPPANDKIANATLIPTYPFTMSEDATGATFDATDPQPPCILYPPQGQNVWFVFTPPAVGAGVYAQAASDGLVYYQYQYVVSAWTGSPGSLKNLGCNIEMSNAPTRLGVIAPSTAPIYLMVSSMLGSATALTFSLDVGPAFTLSASPSSNTVARGTAAAYNVTVTPQYGAFNNPVGLSCYVQPFGPTCSISPRRVTPGNTPASVTLTVNTSTTSGSFSSTSRARSVIRMKPAAPESRFRPWVVLLLGTLFLACGLPARRNAKIGSLAAVAVLVLFGIQTSCGTSNSADGDGSNNPVPSISSLNPSTAAGGGAAFTLNVYGSNFISSSVVRWNGSPRATSYVNSGELRASISANDIASPGTTAPVTVYNPAPGGGTSNAQTFAVSSVQSQNYSVTVVATSGGLLQEKTVSLIVTH